MIIVKKLSHKIDGTVVISKKKSFSGNECNLIYFNEE